ncbi:hypothetical protein BJY27_008049 [Streptomyces rapamycinicus]|uniref:Uncharacterized protein n=1 Tax=Streptomyces rapamycinicus TaxID=1226757 RepID=A0ABR6LXL2_9ACTN|nr:hypothetical protein [Streptomyces rapamycinicus]MBB4787088.1 hypothetical protein [Streptomyces rapamycinicus]
MFVVVLVPQRLASGVDDLGQVPGRVVAEGDQSGAVLMVFAVQQAQGRDPQQFWIGVDRDVIATGVDDPRGGALWVVGDVGAVAFAGAVGDRCQSELSAARRQRGESNCQILWIKARTWRGETPRSVAGWQRCHANWSGPP